MSDKDDLLDLGPRTMEDQELDELHKHAETVLERGTNAEVNKVYPDLLDEVYYSKTTHEDTPDDTVDTEKLLQAERMFCDGLQRALSDILRPRGLVCKGFSPRMRS